MSAVLYLEGGASGADSKYLQVRCREGFRRLIEKCGCEGRMPRLIACGGRAFVFDDFQTALRKKVGQDYVAMWIDSEEPIADIEKTWAHLQNVKTVPRWVKPTGANDDQVLFMSACMETWIVSDRDVLKEHYGSDLQQAALPTLVNLEEQPRHEVHDKLIHATRMCANAYMKGTRSFEILGKLTPAVLKKHLPSFVRVCRILNKKL